MFNEISENHSDHILAIKNAYRNNSDLDLSCDKFSYRKLDKSDFENLFRVVDSLQEKLNYDHQAGSCVFIHPILKQLFSRVGYSSELVFGDVVINGSPYMGCDISTLKDQLSEGVSYEYQRVHCWLLLENGQFFDATLLRDLTNGTQAGEFYHFGEYETQGNTFSYKPILLGEEFIKKTNPQREVHL